jgi:hypothetical protein
MNTYIIQYYENKPNSDGFIFAGTDDRKFYSDEEAKEYAEYQTKHTGYSFYGDCDYDIVEI